MEDTGFYFSSEEFENSKIKVEPTPTPKTKTTPEEMEMAFEELLYGGIDE
jgi:hypothetical protein